VINRSRKNLRQRKARKQEATLAANGGKTKASTETKNTLRYDPSRTLTLRRNFETQLGKGYSSLATKIKDMIVAQDALGLRTHATSLVGNAEGHWVTTDSGQHVFIGPHGEFSPHGPGPLTDRTGLTGVAGMDHPPDKPTVEQFEHWLDKGWSYGAHGWEPPQEQTASIADRNVSTETHAAAAGQLTDKAVETIRSSHSWEDTKPWNMSREQFASNPPAGFKLTSKEHGETAHFFDGTIHLSSGFFKPPMSDHEEARRHVVYHELGHQLADTMVADGTAFQLHDAGVIPTKHDMGSGTGGGHGNEEALADAYALLHTDPKWLEARYPDLIKPVRDRARALGMPLPKSLAGNTRTRLAYNLVSNVRLPEAPEPETFDPRYSVTDLTHNAFMDELVVMSSYFAECERDKQGHCLPSGQAGQGEDKAKPGAKLAGKLKAVGSAVGHAEHVAAAYVKDKVSASVGKLPPRGQSIVHKVWSGLRTGINVAFANFTAMENLAERVAKARGATDEEARRLRGILTTIDTKTFEVFKIAALSGIHAAHAPAIVTASLPIASAAYLAYSTARNPLATMREAGGAIRDALKAGSETLRSIDDKLEKYSIGRAPKLSQRKVGGPESLVRHSDPGVYIDAIPLRNVNPAAQADALAEALEQHDYSDWYIALLHAALDKVNNLEQAITVADEVFDRQPEDNSKPRPDDEEAVFGPYLKTMTRNLSFDELVENWCNQYGGTTCKEGSTGWIAMQKKGQLPPSAPAKPAVTAKPVMPKKPTAAQIKAAERKSAREKLMADKKAEREKVAAEKKSAREKAAAEKKAAKEKATAEKKAAKTKPPAGKPSEAAKPTPPVVPPKESAPAPTPVKQEPPKPVPEPPKQEPPAQPPPKPEPAPVPKPVPPPEGAKPAPPPTPVPAPPAAKGPTPLEQLKAPSHVRDPGPGGRLTPQEVVEVTRDIAKQMGYRGKISIQTGEQPTFELDGKRYKTAGSYNLSTKQIKIYAQSTTCANPVKAAGTMAHEMMHGKFDTVIEAFRSELKTVVDNKLAGEPDVKKKFPAYALMSKFLYDHQDRLIKDDGVSDYSKEYWAQHAKNPSRSNFVLAVDETLAEMASNQIERGKHGGSAVYKEFHDSITKEYARIHAARKAAANPTGNTDTSQDDKHSSMLDDLEALVAEGPPVTMYFDKDKKPTTKDKAYYVRVHDGKGGVTMYEAKQDEEGEGDDKDLDSLRQRHAQEQEIVAEKRRAEDESRSIRRDLEDKKGGV
jgi:hypothetical protein